MCVILLMDAEKHLVFFFTAPSLIVKKYILPLKKKPLFMTEINFFERAFILFYLYFH